MQAGPNESLTVALADQFDEPRSGPFHFFDDRHERAFQSAFAECRVRRVSGSRLRNNEGRFQFVAPWAGIPTKEQHLTYYALCLPEHAIPVRVLATDPRSRREHKKVVVRDDQRERFVVYLEWKSSHGSFDFRLEVDFRIAEDEFPSSEFRDETTTQDDAYRKRTNARLHPVDRM